MAGKAEAAAGAWWNTDQGAVRLIASGAASGSAESLAFGLHFRMNPGWKVYWRSPGDAGFPPQPDWSGSENMASATVSWPLPRRFTVLGLRTLGYKDEVVLPVSVVPFEPGKPVTLRATVRYLTCNEVCVPYEAPLALTLPAGPDIDTPEAGLIRRFAARVPTRGATSALALTEVAVDGPPGSQTLRLHAVAATRLEAPDVIIEGPPGFGFGLPRMEARDGGRSAVLRISVSPPPPPPKAAASTADLAGRKLTVTLAYAGGAIERRITPAVGDVTVMPLRPVGDAGAGGPAFAMILALALLGGLILNLMPCVLPVLSMKLLSVVGHGGGEPARVRAGFLASSAGILVSFVVLATAAVAVKAAGLSVGWGIQFQQPVFLIAMALIVTLFAANMWGLFEIRLPGRLADAAATAGHGGHGNGLAGHFSTGVFATLLATPCTAPFLGTAIGFALSRGAVEIYSVFIALGIGLALPYLVVAAVPRLATSLPRPGHWMVTLRRILGLALAVTALWLVSVLEAQAGVSTAIFVLFMLVLLVAMLGLSGRLPRLRRDGAWSVVAILAVVSFLASAADVAPARSVAEPDKTSGGINWRPFDPAAIAVHVAAGNVVFVDVTADWCLTCKVNKALVLDRGEVQKLLAGPDVIAMQADWTRPDPVIAAFLQRFSRYGIPFDAVFGPGTPRGRVLPELLTTDRVLAGLAAAAGARRISTR